MTDTIFDTPEDRTQGSLFEDLVGEGKKFKTNDDLARGKAEADRYIDQLKTEMAELRSDLAARVKLEDVIDRLASRNNEDQHELPNLEPNDRSGQPAISSDAIERLIETKITNRDKERTARENRDSVKAKLTEVFGADYPKRLEDRREALGLDKDTLNNLASRSPTAFMELVAPRAAERPGFVPPRSSVASEHFIPNPQAQPGSRSWYDNLRKSDPTTYWTPKVQWQMHQDAIKAANAGQDF